MINKLKIVMIKPSTYVSNGFVERYKRGYMPNSTLWYMRSMTPDSVEHGGRKIVIEVETVDEMVTRDLNYLRFDPEPSTQTLVALVGTQSHQIQRACDIATLAINRGAQAIIGGPHTMSCQTEELQNRGISFSLAEADLVWPEILQDSVDGQLQSVYGLNKRWQDDLLSPILLPPPREHLEHHVVSMGGIYASRGCPYACDFCMIYKFAGHSVRSQSVETTLASIRNLKSAGIKIIVFTGDNTNKMKELPELCDAMVEEGLTIPWMAQCDAQIGQQEWLVEKMSRSGCRFIMVGVESFSRETLKKAKKNHNHPEQYLAIARLVKKYGIVPIFSNIIGFMDDTVDSVRDHVRRLKEVAPIASYFFIMTPAPGSDQYHEYKKAGLITEKNLDRFDATYPCWSHPNLSHTDLLQLLYESYESYHNIGDMVGRLFSGWKQGLSFQWSLFGLGYAALMRHKARQRIHPLRGGLMQFSLDHVDEYIGLRKKTFGCEYFSLPDNLTPTKPDLDADQERMRQGTLLPILRVV